MFVFLISYSLVKMYAFQTPFTCTISGSSGSGKTFFVYRLIKNRRCIFKDSPKVIVYAYDVYQPIFQDLEQNHGVKFIRGLPTIEHIDELKKYDSSLIILDDLMAVAFDSELVQSLYTVLSHHHNISVLNICQNIFFRGRYSKTININTHVYVLFKTIRGNQQLTTLAVQLFGAKFKALRESFNDCVLNSRYPYLVCDSHPKTDPRLALRTNIFEDETIVYTPL